MSHKLDSDSTLLHAGETGFSDYFIKTIIFNGSQPKAKENRRMVFLIILILALVFLTELVFVLITSFVSQIIREMKMGRMRKSIEYRILSDLFFTLGEAFLGADSVFCGVSVMEIVSSLCEE